MSHINPHTYLLDDSLHPIEVRRWEPPRNATDATKPPLLAVHGGGGSTAVWAKVARCLAQTGRTVVAFSWYNHGLSHYFEPGVFARRGIIDIAETELATVARHVIDEYGSSTRQIDLMGHSMGGAASLSFSASNCNAVRKLVPISPVVPAEFSGPNVEIPVTPYEPQITGAFEVQRPLFWPTVSEEIAYAEWLKWALESPTAIFEASRWTHSTNVRRIHADTLAVTADPALDIITPPAGIIAMANAMGAEHYTLSGVGHSETLFVSPAWQQLSQVVTDFLDA